MYLHILSWRIGAELVRRMGIDIRETGFITTDYQQSVKENYTVNQLRSYEINYTLVGDYYIPNIALPEENRPR